MRRVFQIVAWWVRKMLHLYEPDDCAHGKCHCLDATWCYYPRCKNCDSHMDAAGHSLNDDWAEERNRCPDCGGKLQPL